ncbi:MAG: SDR family oxidoreductase [Clostridiales bacterium]|nr:SDR family oxidoreductase [Clostridiales bacterium]
MEDLKNKVALVTSATRGIGLACALKLAFYGAHVFLGVRRLEVAEEICSQYKQYCMTPVFFDATKLDSYPSMVEETIKQAGKIDILVNNYGIGQPADDLDLIHGKEEAFFHIIEQNLGSVYRITKLVLPHMIQKGSGSIINISSIGGIIPDITRIGYGVSKAAVNNITQQIALQYARQGIRCNAILPGLTATDAALQHMPQTFIDSFLSHVPLNRMGKPEDIANAVAFFASDVSSYITGHILDVAGGYGIGTPQYADTIRQK